MVLDSMVSYLEGRADAPRSKAYNPFPRGHIVKGGGTDVTLTFFKHQPARWFFHNELILALGRSKGEVDWALRQLLELGYIESATHQDAGRAPVLKYRFKQRQAA